MTDVARREGVSQYLSRLFGLDGKVAVVIGGTGILGGVIAQGLHAAGARLVIVGRNEAAGLRSANRLNANASASPSAIFRRCDATQKSELEALLDSIQEEFGATNILVNAAGVNSATPFFEISEEEWDRIMSVNLKSVLFACQVFGKQMVDRGQGGSIINVSSMAAITPLSKVFTYSASKAAVVNITQNLAREWAPHRVRVNCLAPGFFPAEQNRKILTQERIADIMRHTPMNRFGQSEELVGTTLLLASDTAGSFITGANIPVDGGYSAMTI